MQASDLRGTLRRQTHEANSQLIHLVDALRPVDAEAADAVQRARAALFEAWTILCAHQADDDEDH